MHPSFNYMSHRPWPLPAGAWQWRQAWLDLAFIHYRVDPGALRERIPAELALEEFDGSAWVTLVPFRMAGVTRRPLPPVPLLSSFPELNLRTYVRCGRKPGVWFFSLDAASWPMAWGGRLIYDLPYFTARMRHTVRGGWHDFACERRGGAPRFTARYRPVGDVFWAEPGTLDHWLAERYCLYSFSARRGLARVEVHHAPWPLQRAEVAIETCSLLSAVGLTPVSEPVCHFSRGVEVVSYAREVVARGVAGS